MEFLEVEKKRKGREVIFLQLLHDTTYVMVLCDMVVAKVQGEEQMNSFFVTSKELGFARCAVPPHLSAYHL
jgi:hypothetical protein